MASINASLTEEDLRTLVKGVTPDARAIAAHKLCRAIDRERLSPQEQAQAHEILRLMARDAAELVRRALSVTLKSSPVLPRDVALRLARDLDSIAMPVLNFSPVFTEEDLIDIVRRGGPARQAAIARRPLLQQAVAGALIEVGCEEAVGAVCANDNIPLAPPVLQTAIDRFPQSESVLKAIVHRKTLPPAVTERLIALVSGNVRAHLIEFHSVSPEAALQLSTGVRERATLDLVDQSARTADIGAFVAHLNRNGRLTASLLLRALAQGQMGLLEWGVSELSGVPHHRTWLMIHDAGPLGLKAIYERAGLPVRLFPAFRSGIDTYHSLSLNGGANDKAMFQERMLQRFLTQPHTIAREDLDYLLEKMDRLADETLEPPRAVERRAGRALH